MTAVDRADVVRKLFEPLPGISEVSAVYCIPRINPPWGGKESLCYSVEGVQDDGSTLFLRSHGTRFNILPRPWLGRGMCGCFSVGPGLVGFAQETVVLLQWFAPPSASSALANLAADAIWSGTAIIESCRVYDRQCHLLSAILLK